MLIIFLLVDDFVLASMKALPKRKGNAAFGESSLQNIKPQ